jgi:ubiquinone/menaquinone biosynthesis C-methylase UbiE
MAILDIASGDGAILEILISIDDRIGGKVTCVDASPAAIDSIGSRYPAATGIVADAAAIPLDDNGFALVTSQFGVEYAGIDAINEAARLVAPGGRMILLMHMRGSLMHRECEAALDAIRATEKSGFIPLALSMFESGFAAVAGADRGGYDAAAARLNPAVRQIEKIIVRYGENVAGGTISALYSGVAAIHSEIQHYEPRPVLDWLRSMNEEMRSFAGRMQSMDRAALNEAEYSKVRARLQQSGFKVDVSDRVNDHGGVPLGWLALAEASS